MRKLLLAALLLAATHAGAQSPWQCLITGIKQYFSNEMHYLRGMRIDSVRTIGPATVLYPFHSRRIRDGFRIDSTGGSWLGKEVRCYADGRSEFVNYWNDTVVIRTLADSGDSWFFYADSSSLRYRATVIRIDSATIDGQADSIKTIQLSAIRNGAVIPGHPINNYRIILSRAHGFREIFDLYTFPYSLPGGAPLRNPFDYSLQLNPFDRPEAAIFRPISYRNPLRSELYDFQPGDMLRRGDSRQDISRYSVIRFQTVQDSIASRQRISGGIEYRMSVWSASGVTSDDPALQSSYRISGPGTATRFYADESVNVVDSAFMPEEWGRMFAYYYDPADSSRCVVSASYRRQEYAFPTPLEGRPRESVGYKVGFGLTDSAGGSRYGVYNELWTYFRQSLEARKTGANCREFVPLKVPDAQEGAILSLSPNPARDRFTIELPTTATRLRLEIIDMSGRRLLLKEINGGRAELSTTGLPDGIYTVRVSGESLSMLQRLQIAR